ncbi:hypothetical protein AB2B41_14635 [Marimonas sp. MJW-29]|uniref:Uncharacterized protein n=1 Tax=Sulfitobacter sediminis TaxID=3234186 RepID=A0ABV3RS22_9RHOB
MSVSNPPCKPSASKGFDRPLAALSEAERLIEDATYELADKAAPQAIAKLIVLAADLRRARTEIARRSARKG